MTATTATTAAPEIVIWTGCAGIRDRDRGRSLFTEAAAGGSRNPPQAAHEIAPLARLRRSSAHPVLVKVDEELTVEVRAVAPTPALKRSAADAFREVGRWEGETGEELDALFADVRQRPN